MNETNEQQSLDLLSSEQLGEALEAVLFASGYPLSFEKLAQTFQKTEKEMRCFAEEYAKAYNQSSRGILFLILDDSCQLCSKEEYKEYIRTAMGIKSSGKLSASCLEALAIIAYAPGKPILYGTTEEFLRVFGLRSLEELPTVSSALPLAEKGKQTTIEEASGAVD